MTKEQSFDSADHLDLHPFMSSQTRERTLNAAIVRANISESFEEHLEIFDAFYDDDIEVTTDTGEEPIRGKARVRSLLANFLVPLDERSRVLIRRGGFSPDLARNETPIRSKHAGLMAAFRTGLSGKRQNRGARLTVKAHRG
jgi:hypothetical protein